MNFFPKNYLFKNVFIKKNLILNLNVSKQNKIKKKL